MKTKPNNKNAAAAPIAYGYVRVSTSAQAEEGVSLEAQQEKIRQYCLLHGLRLEGLYTDAGISGRRAANRPSLQAAMKAATEAKAALVVYSLSRFARSTRDALDLAERLSEAGARLVSISENVDTQSAMGEFFFTLMAALARLESSQVSERTRMALGHLRSQGKRISGRPPIGYRFVGDGMEVDPAQMRAIAEIQAMAKAGYSLRSTVAALAAKGTTNHAGKPYTLAMVRTALAAAIA